MVLTGLLTNTLGVEDRHESCEADSYFDEVMLFLIM